MPWPFAGAVVAPAVVPVHPPNCDVTEGGNPPYADVPVEVGIMWCAGCSVAPCGGVVMYCERKRGKKKYVSSMISRSATGSFAPKGKIGIGDSQIVIIFSSDAALMP